MADRRVLLANGLYHLTNDGSLNVLPALFPILRDDLGFGYAEVGLLTAVALVITIVFQLVFGALSDRMEPKILMPIGIAWLGIGLLLIATSTTFGALFLFVALARIGAGAYHAVGISWISKEYRGADVDRAMGVQSAFGDTGVLLGLLPSGFLALAWGWEGVFVFWGVLNLLAAVAGIALTARTPSRRAARVAIDPIDVLRRVAPWIPPLAAGGGVFTITVTFGPLLLTDRMGLPTSWADVAVGSWIGTGAIAALSFGTISRRFGRFPAMMYAFLGIAVGGVMIAAATDLLTVVLGLVAFVALVFITYPALFSFISDVADVRAQGLAFGVIFGFQLVGGALAAYAAGELANLTGSPAVPFYLLAGIALATFAYLLGFREVRANEVRAPAPDPSAASVPFVPGP